jgi:colanic acid biosynthesis glycosyl transferase WcaI
MRILVLIIQYPPDVNTSGALMAQVCEGLAARGHEVSVVTSFPHYEKFRVWDEYRGKLLETDVRNGVQVKRTCVLASGCKQKMLNRLLSYLSFNVLATVVGVTSRREYDVILCSNGSFFSGLAATVIGRCKGAPFIYNVQDLYPETPVQARQITNRVVIDALERIERFMYARAAHVSVIAPGFRDNLLGKSVPADKVTTIPNFVDVDFIRPYPKLNAFSREYGLTDKFVVTHAGNLGYVYDLDALLDVAQRVRVASDIQFLIVGDGVERKRLERRTRGLGLDNVRFLPFQPRERLPLLRAASDVQVALYRDGSARFSMPSKVYEIMASGRPVLASADPDSDLQRLVTRTRCGICIEPHNPEKLSAALLALYRDPMLRTRMGERGRDAAVKAYSRDAIVLQYEELCEAVASRATKSRGAGRAARSRVGRRQSPANLLPRSDEHHHRYRTGAFLECLESHSADH